jgi:hypothetical protein
LLLAWYGVNHWGPCGPLLEYRFRYRRYHVMLSTFPYTACGQVQLTSEPTNHLLCCHPASLYMLVRWPRLSPVLNVYRVTPRVSMKHEASARRGSCAAPLPSYNALLRTPAIPPPSTRSRRLPYPGAPFAAPQPGPPLCHRPVNRVFLHFAAQAMASVPRAGIMPLARLLICGRAKMGGRASLDVEESVIGGGISYRNVDAFFPIYRACMYTVEEPYHTVMRVNPSHTHMHRTKVYS